MKTTLLAIACFAVPLMATAETPYAGQQTRDIAALSPQDVDDLLNGRGWGFAKSAELNGYPGPAHVLELADDLQLTANQRQSVEEIWARMNEEARTLGAAYVEAEAALDQAFETADIAPDQLTRLTDTAGALRAELRAVHLAAHLETTPLVTRHQRMVYNDLRGYGSDQSGGHSGHSHN